MRSVTVGGQLLRVAVRPGPNGTGGGHRPPLLLINGIGASLELLQPFVAELDPAVTVIRFDPPGVGVYHGGHLGLVTEAAALAPVVDGFLADPEEREVT